jgi:hypothetical protein
MKKVARFVIFSSLTVVLLLVFSIIFRFFAYWIESVKTVSNIMDTEQTALITIIRQALPETLFLSILFSLSYSVRKKIPALISIIVLFILSGTFCLGFFMGVEKIEAMDIPVFSNFPLTAENIELRPGIILSTRDMDMILLKENDGLFGNNPGTVGRTAFSGFPRIISFPESALIYQEVPISRDTTFFNLPLGEEIPWFLQSILIDLNLTARELDLRYKEGLASFFLHGFSLILLLVSLRFLFGMSSWPLANLFLGAMAFRGVLSLQIFLITPETGVIIRSFLGNRVEGSLIPPLVFLVLSALVILYTFLAFLARRGKEEE